MKKISKILAAILAPAMLLSLYACGGDNGSEENAQIADNPEVKIEETVLADEQGIKAVAKSFGKYEGELFPSDYALMIDVTNNTDKNVSVGLNNASVNGYMVGTNFSINIEPGKTELYPASFNDFDIEKYGITTFADFEFCFKAEDADTNETIIETKPISIKTSAADSYDYKYDESGKVVYDADGVKIIAKNTFEDDFLGQCVNFYVSNQTDKNISVMANEGTVNGKPAEIIFGSDVFSGKHAIDMLSLGENDRVDKIESLTLKFTIYDSDSGEPIVEPIDSIDVTF